MAINIITYSGKTRTAKHDAIVYDAALDRNGVFNGCTVTANSNILSVALGYGIIKGRVFEITSEDFSLVLPGSGSEYGALIVTLDLNSETPLILENVRSSNKTFNLAKDETANFSNGRYQMFIATYTLTPTGITDIVQAAHIIPRDHIGSKDLNDYVESGVYFFHGEVLKDFANVPSGETYPPVNGWLVVYDGRRYDGLKSAAVKQILWRFGSATSHYRTYVRTMTDGTWSTWRWLVTDADLYNIPHSVQIGTETGDGAILTVRNKHRYGGINVSTSLGIWDVGNNEWMIFSSPDRTVNIPHPLVVSGILQARKSFEIGAASIYPTAANTVMKVNVKFAHEMAGVPRVTVTPSTSVPNTVSVGIANVTTKGFELYGLRNNSTGMFGVNYIAVCTT